MLRFSGHDTFQCKEQWLLKGLQLVDKEGGTKIFRENEAIFKLGVGKNMVRSIQHWLRAFGLLNDANDISELSTLLFMEEKLDPFLENEGSLWILQYHLCKTEYASIFKLIFAEYFLDKANLEFSESQILSFLNRKITEGHYRKVTKNTLSSDYKVFIKTYLVSQRNLKTIEDDFSAPLLPLNIIANTGRKNPANENIYKINRGFQDTLAPEIFIYCLLSEFENEKVVNLDTIRNSVGAYLCLDNDGLDRLIRIICDANKEFVYKEDAGIKQLQIKRITGTYKIDLLKNYYGLHN